MQTFIDPTNRWIRQGETWLIAWERRWFVSTLSINMHSDNKVFKHSETQLKLNDSITNYSQVQNSNTYVENFQIFQENYTTALELGDV